MGNKFYLIDLLFPWIKELDLAFVTVEYRLAAELPAPAQVEYCYVGLKWVGENSARLGIDADKIIVAGASAGGCFAAPIPVVIS